MAEFDIACILHFILDAQAIQATTRFTLAMEAPLLHYHYLPIATLDSTL